MLIFNKTFTKICPFFLMRGAYVLTILFIGYYLMILYKLIVTI
jgi:hypothetical protein